jgi:hypothetical protein
MVIERQRRPQARAPDGLKLARRTVLLDQAGFGASYLNVFM